MSSVKASLLFLLIASPLSSMAALQCGNFYLKSGDDGWMRVNGVKAESQKITFLKAKEDYDNVKIQIMLPDKNTGRWLGMDYIRRNGKPILNVEAVRMNMEEPRVFGTYDCVKVR